ncbi:MAG: transglutaminase domain-containing protein [Candidatus Diapherotrites archaeon]|uniref:Transglutaminase domain-containing protein n=1 Tax=Candidatus Iainarchaeum sp. TaxID=3101447 RepID=A0A8T4L6S7_9ARCH|nr:transglutaminase domain-containing protein [Candidatus Diapherotrites archaeon]
MRVTAVLLTVLFFTATACAQLEINPNTVGEMKAHVQMHVSGGFSGDLTSQDTMTIKLLTFQNYPGQTVEQNSEKLVIQNQTIEPRYETIEGNRYAVFELKNLVQYLQDPSFDIYSDAIIKTRARFALHQDYNLTRPMTENTEFILPSDYIESDDATLSAKVQLEFQSASELETIRHITEWVHENIAYDYGTYYNGVWSARQTYENRAGVCDEFANLTAAFLRIKKIPTRYVTGISFDGQRFGNHGWTESYLPGTGWIGVDATYGEAGYLDAMHVALGKTTDTNQLKNVLIFTTSVNGIDVTASLQDPYVDLNSLEFQTISNLVVLRFIQHPRAGLNQNIQFQAELTNLTDSTIIIPAELALHPDFSISQGSKQILLLPNEKKTVSWTATTPKTGKPGYITTYGVRLALPDQTIESKIEIRPDVKVNDPISQDAIQVLDVSPMVENDAFTIQTQIQNTSTKTIPVTIELVQGTRRVQSQAPIEPQQTLRMNVRFPDPVPGSLLVSIQGDKNHAYSFMIPEPKPASKPDPDTPPDSNIQTPAPPEETNSFLDALWNALKNFFKAIFG